MKTISTELKNHLGQSTLTIARCWKITLSDSSVMGFTSCSKDITYESQVYYSLTGFENESVKSKLDIDFDESRAVSILNSDYITEADLIAGKYNNAEVKVFVVNYEDLTQGRILLFKGYLSDVRCEDGKFFGELKGLSSKLEQTIGEVYSPLCRAKFCSSECGLMASSYTFSGVVSSITDNAKFYCDTSVIKTKNSGYFNYGVINFTGGNNSGLSMEVKQFSSGNFVLTMEMPYDIAVDDTFDVLAGCNKRFTTCCNDFDNGVNFRGEPHLPGMEMLLKSY